MIVLTQSHMPSLKSSSIRTTISRPRWTSLSSVSCGSDDPKQPGFYLIMAMGSEQAGLDRRQGAIIRKAAVGRSVSNLQNALMSIRNALEHNQ